MRQATALTHVVTRDAQGPVVVCWGLWDQAWPRGWEGIRSDFLEQVKH